MLVIINCGELAISLHSYTVPLVQCSTRLLPVMRDLGSIPRGVLTVCETGILLLEFSHYIGDPNVIDHCGLVWGGLCPELSLGRSADNVIIPLINKSVKLNLTKLNFFHPIYHGPLRGLLSPTFTARKKYNWKSEKPGVWLTPPRLN